MKRTRLQSRIRPIKGYQDGGRTLEDEVDQATQFVPLERAYTGLGEQTNRNDVVDRLQHPTYEQLAADKDLRRGRTRMAPRGRGAEGGFGYADGGPVKKPFLAIPTPGSKATEYESPSAGSRAKALDWQMKNPGEMERSREPFKDTLHYRDDDELGEYQEYLNRGGRVNKFDEAGVVPAQVRNPIGGPQPEPRRPLEVPIGRGTLMLNPEYQPEQTMGGYARYELPVGDQGWSVGAQGHVDRYIGPGYEQVPVQGGGGLFARKRFRKGGRVKKFAEGGDTQVAEAGDTALGRDLGDPLRPDAEYESIGRADDPNVKPRTIQTNPGEYPDWDLLSSSRRNPTTPEWWRRRQRPMSAVDTGVQFGRRGGRVKKFQDGGVQVAERGDRRRFDDEYGESGPPGEYESIGIVDLGKEPEGGDLYWRGMPEKVDGVEHPAGSGTYRGEPFHRTMPAPTKFKRELWRKLPGEKPLSAIDTGVQSARRGGVMKYQTGGWTEDAQGNPIVPTEPPQQPAPAAAGQTTPATPPPAQTPAPAPTAAIATKEFPDPLADFKDDAEIAREKAEEDRMISTNNIRSTRPSGEFSTGALPGRSDENTHPEWDKLQELKSMLPEIRKTDTTKTGRYIKEAQTTVDALERRIHNETIRSDTTKHKEFMNKEKQAVHEADQKRRVGIMQLPDLDTVIQGKYQAIDLEHQRLIENAKTPEARRDYTLLQSALPTKTMKDNERALVARSLLNLNHDLDQSDVTQLVTQLATPPVRGQKGFNELTGRAAANYKLDVKDPIGNYVVYTATGPYRIDPRSYGLIKNARNIGYDNMIANHKTYIDAKRREERPGWVARKTDEAIDAVRGVFK